MKAICREDVWGRVIIEAEPWGLLSAEFENGLDDFPDGSNSAAAPVSQSLKLVLFRHRIFPQWSHIFISQGRTRRL